MFDFQTSSELSTEHLASLGVTLQPTHIKEILAALLGYDSYAAYDLENNLPGSPDLNSAQIVVLVNYMGMERCQELGIPEDEANTVVGVLSEGVLSVMNVKPADDIPYDYRQQKAFLNIQEFFDDYLKQRVQEIAMKSPEVADVCLKDNVEADLANVESMEIEDYAKLDDAVIANGEGKIFEPLDFSKPLNNDHIFFTVKILFEKAGRIGLREVGHEVTATFVRDPLNA